MIKKAIVVILILVLLVGCNNTEPQDISSSEAGSSSVSSAPPSSATEPEPNPNYMPKDTAPLAGEPLAMVGEKVAPNTTGYEYLGNWYHAVGENLYFVDKLEVEASAPEASTRVISRLVQYDIMSEEYKIVYQTDALDLKSGCMLENGDLIYTGNWAENSAFVDYGIYIYNAETGREDCIVNVDMIGSELRSMVLSYKTQKLYYSIFYFSDNAAELYEYDLVTGEASRIAENVYGFDISDEGAYYISDYELYRLDESGSTQLTTLDENPGIASLVCYGQFVLVLHEDEGMTLIDTVKNISTYKSFCQEPGLVPCADENGFMLFGGSPIEERNRLYVSSYLLDYNGNLRMANKQYAPILHITDDLVFYHENFNGATIHSMSKAEFLAKLTLI